jgi:hypothetical protein
MRSNVASSFSRASSHPWLLGAEDRLEPTRQRDRSTTRRANEWTIGNAEHVSQNVRLALRFEVALIAGTVRQFGTTEAVNLCGLASAQCR